MSNEGAMKRSMSFGEAPIAFITLPLFLIPLPEAVQKLPIEKTDKIKAYVSKLTVHGSHVEDVFSDSEEGFLSLDQFEINSVALPEKNELKDIRLELKKSPQKKKKLKSINKFSALLFSSKRRGGGTGGVVVIERKKEEVDLKALREKQREKQINISKTIRRIENFEDEEDSEEESEEEEEEGEDEEEEEEEGEEDEDTVIKGFVKSDNELDFDLSELDPQLTLMKDVDGLIMKSLNRKVERFVNVQKSKRREMHRENQRHAKKHLQGITKRFTPLKDPKEEENKLQRSMSRRSTLSTPRTPRTPGSPTKDGSQQQQSSSSQSPSSGRTKKSESSNVLGIPQSAVRQRSNSEKPSSGQNTPNSSRERRSTSSSRNDYRAGMSKIFRIPPSSSQFKKIEITSSIEIVKGMNTRNFTKKSQSKKDFDAKDMARSLKKLTQSVDSCLQKQNEIISSNPTFITQQQQQHHGYSSSTDFLNRHGGLPPMMVPPSRIMGRPRRKASDDSEEKMNHSLLDASKNPYTLNSKKFRGNVNSYESNRRKKMRKRNPFPDIKPPPILTSASAASFLETNNHDRINHHNKNFMRTVTSSGLRSHKYPNYANRMRNYKTSPLKMESKKKSRKRYSNDQSRSYRPKFSGYKNKTELMFANVKDYMRSLPSTRKFRRRRPKSAFCGRKSRRSRSSMRYKQRNRPATTSVSSRRSKRGRKQKNNYNDDDDDEFSEIFFSDERKRRKTRPKSAIGFREMLSDTSVIDKHFHKRYRPMTSPNGTGITRKRKNKNEIVVEGKRGEFEMKWNGRRNQYNKGFTGTIRVCRLSDTLKGYKI